MGFEIFHPELYQALAYSDAEKAVVHRLILFLMFKIQVIQTLNNLINDRLSFMRFLGLGLLECVPDAKMVWLFRERLTPAGAIEILFNRFDAILRDAGCLPM